MSRQSVTAFMYEQEARIHQLEEALGQCVEVLEEVAQYDTGEQPCIGSDAKQAIPKAKSLLEK